MQIALEIDDDDIVKDDDDHNRGHEYDTNNDGSDIDYTLLLPQLLLPTAVGILLSI